MSDDVTPIIWRPRPFEADMLETYTAAWWFKQVVESSDRSNYEQSIVLFDVAYDEEDNTVTGTAAVGGVLNENTTTLSVAHITLCQPMEDNKAEAVAMSWADFEEL